MLGDAVDKDKTSGGDIIKSITDTDPRDGEADKRKLGPGPETISIGQGIRLIKMSSLLLQAWHDHYYITGLSLPCGLSGVFRVV